MFFNTIFSGDFMKFICFGIGIIVGLCIALVIAVVKEFYNENK